jgi:ferredoxin-NADP reductase
MALRAIPNRAVGRPPQPELSTRRKAHPMQRPIEWQIATVKAITQETPKVKTFTLQLPRWLPHRAGQHYDVRLTAADGYQAQRSYSIASEPERTGEIDLTVERLEDGEVSGYLHHVLVPGDLVEVRGPIGGYFVWEARAGGPLLLIGGGSGIVPLMSMIRHRRAASSNAAARLLYSSRAPEDVIYREELDRIGGDGLEIIHTFTRSQPPGWHGYARRIDRQMLQEVAGPLGRHPMIFICGPTQMVETAAAALVQAGIPANQIRTERFGPSGS